jgi:glutathione S-transferase
MLTVLGTVRTRTLRVLWLLEELGLAYAHVAAGPRSAEVRALNPSGKVPVLLVDGQALTDSTAILQFLADRSGRFTFGAGTLDRARQDGWTQFVLDEIEGPLWAASRHSFILPEERRVPGIKETLRWEFARAEAGLAGRMGAGPFLMGDDMTVPDVILAHCLMWAGLARFPVTEPRLIAYLGRMQVRPALQRAMAR